MVCSIRNQARRFCFGFIRHPFTFRDAMTSEVFYSAVLTAGSLKVRESRLIAGLLLQGVSSERFKDAIFRENILQTRSPITAARLASLVRARLECFDQDLWRFVHDGDKHLATQSLLAAAVKHSDLLRDFMDLVLRDEYRLLHTHLASGLWTAFLDGCAARNPSIADWSESTRKRLRSTIFQILSQAGYLLDTSERELKRVVILPQLQHYLENRHEHAVLRSIQFP